MKPYRLRLPGPTEVPEQVRLAMAAPMVNHRGPEFAAILADVSTALQRIIGSTQPVLLFGASGTAMMEAALTNACNRHDRVLFLVNGQFSERFASVAEAYAIPTRRHEIEWGQACAPSELEQLLESNDYQAVVAVHNASSTGAVNDLAALGAVIKQTPALFIVDSVSGLAGMEVQQDNWGVDILIGASQKALMCPPGIGLLSASAKAWRRIEANSSAANFYFDLIKARDSALQGQTPFTPPVSLVYALNEALCRIDNEGLGAVIERHALLARAFRAGAQALGLPSFPTSPLVSNTVQVLSLPAALDASDVVAHLYREYGTAIAGARNKLRGRVIRFGTMGAIGPSDILTDLFQLEQTLCALGANVERGDALASATTVLNQT